MKKTNAVPGTVLSKRGGITKIQLANGRTFSYGTQEAKVKVAVGKRVPNLWLRACEIAADAFPTSTTHTTTRNGRTFEISDSDFQRLGKRGKTKVTDLRTGEILMAEVTRWKVA